MFYLPSNFKLGSDIALLINPAVREWWSLLCRTEETEPLLEDLISSGLHGSSKQHKPKLQSQIIKYTEEKSCKYKNIRLCVISKIWFFGTFFTYFFHITTFYLMKLTIICIVTSTKPTNLEDLGSPWTEGRHMDCLLILHKVTIVWLQVVVNKSTS